MSWALFFIFFRFLCIFPVLIDTLVVGSTTIGHELPYASAELAFRSCWFSCDDSFIFKGCEQLESF